ncbi:MAG: hypothetical protein ACK5DR_02490 [Planctomyces sp.]
MARRQYQHSVSLFPFLAVLVCAMGSLILLLLVMTRKIRHDQQAELSATRTTAAAVQPVDRSAELQAMEQNAAELQTRLQGLQQKVTALKSELEQKHQQLAQTRAELAGLQAQLQAAAAPGAAASTEADLQHLKSEEAELLARLTTTEQALLAKRDELTRAEDAVKEAELLLFEKQSAIVALREQIQSAEAQAAAVSGVRTLVEFSNSTGTTRTPIVIDVSAGGFEFLPNAIRVTMADMEKFPVRDNPLLSAILAIHQHRSGRSLTAEPYVLLLVRPGGSLPFYGAQRILTEAKIHYGYELLTAARKVVVDGADLLEPPAVQLALQEAFRRREALYARLFDITQDELSRRGLAAGQQPDSEQPAERRLSVRPDGRVMEEESKSRRRLENRYYAGGVAPPPSFYTNRATARATNPSGGRLSAAEAEQMAEQFAENYARQRALNQAAEETRKSLTAMREGRQPGPATAITPGTAPADVAASLRNPSEKRFADALFDSDGSLQGSKLVGRRSDAFSATPLGAAARAPRSEGTAANPSQPTVSTASAPRSATTDDMPWYQPSKPDPATGTTGSQIPGAPAAGSQKSRFGGGEQQTAGQPQQPARIDRDTLRRIGPVGARGNSALAAPVGIVVFLDDQHLTVAQQPALDLKDQQLSVAEAELLRGVNQELADARRRPDDQLLPIVRFIVSPGGEKWRQPLAQSLKRTGIQSVTLYEITPHMLPADDTGYASVPETAEAQP